MIYRAVKLFKKYFIPHEHNDHKPHILRIESALVIFGFILFIQIVLLGFTLVATKTNLFATILPNVLIEMTNNDRISSSLGELSENKTLAYAAQLKAEDMAQKGYFDHNSPEGLTPWHWFDLAGYRFSYAGENLAVNFFDAKDVENAWMNSVKHRENILNNNFTEIGIGTARGIYEGKDAVFVVQLFGRPSIKQLAAVDTQNKILPPATEQVLPQSNEEKFIAVKGEEAVPLTKEPNSDANSQPAGQKPLLRSNILNQINELLVMPRTIANLLYLTLFTIISVALLLKIFVKIKIQHPPLIVNGIFLLMIIASSLVLNQYLFLNSARIFAN